jgi:hypothetical protein
LTYYFLFFIFSPSRKKKGEKNPSTLPPPFEKRKGKGFREDAEILIYKGRTNHNAN